MAQCRHYKLRAARISFFFIEISYGFRFLRVLGHHEKWCASIRFRALDFLGLVLGLRGFEF